MGKEDKNTKKKAPKDTKLVPICSICEKSYLLCGCSESDLNK